MVQVYMAGPMTHTQDNGRGWRNRLKQKHPEITWLDPWDTEDPSDPDWFNPKVVDDDLEMIEKADAMLVHWEDVKSVGTAMEIVYAANVFHISVIVQTTVEDPSPWLTYHADAVVETFDAAVKMLKMVEGYKQKA